MFILSNSILGYSYTIIITDDIMFKCVDKVDYPIKLAKFMYNLDVMTCIRSWIR
jgi:hypothetical protein